MKSEKEQAKSKKKAKDNALLKVKKNVSGNSQDEIREKANEIYLQRIERGEYGTPDGDWAEAEKLLNESEI